MQPWYQYNAINWILIFLWQIYVIGLGVSIAKKRKSVVDEELDSSDDDSDEELIST